MGIKGRPRKPEHLKLLAGTHRPDRNNPDAPRPTPGAERPRWLGKVARLYWNALAPGLIADGLLTDRSAMQLAVACDAMEKIQALGRVCSVTYLKRAAKASQYPQAAALLKQYTKVFQETSAKLGLSPADWQRIKVQPPAPKANPFEGIGA